MESFGDPTVMLVSVVFGLISFVLMTAGMRSQNAPMAIWGVAFGAPSYAPNEPIFWALGALFGFFAWWLGRMAA